MKIKALTISAIVNMAVVAVLTVAAEISTPLKGYLADLTGHHWVTKSIIAITGFAVLSVILQFVVAEESDPESIKKDTNRVIMAFIACSAVITLYYAWHLLAS